MSTHTIISIVLAILMILGIIASHYFVIKSQIEEAVTDAINDAETTNKAGEQKLELATEQLYSLVPVYFKIFITKEMCKRIVQAAFNKIEAYAKKQVEKKK